MYKFEEPSMFSGKRGAALIAVIFIHVIVGYGFYTGLASKFITKIVAPVEVSQIDKPKEIDKPPPPPPKLEEIKPFVPPPEFVDIQSAPPPETAITTTQVNTPPPPTAVAAPAPVAAAIPGTPPRQDPRHPINVDDYYPSASQRANEEGRCLAKVKIGTDGRISEAEISTSTSFARLDEACLKVAKLIRMIPATQNGKPVETVTVLPIMFKFKK